MTASSRQLQQPSRLKNAEGKPRRVGVEMEMTGLALDELAEAVASFFGGLQVEERGRYERVLKGDKAGDWVVELDYALLKRLGREEHDDDTFEGSLANTTEDAIALVAEEIVPLEVVGPPLPIDRLGEVEDLIVHLRAAGAKGVSDSLINAFGMQFNPELASHDARYIAACLKAFMCLTDWLVDRADIDISRKMTSYVNPFPSGYVRKMIDPDYWPDLSTLIDDYLVDNPTRNRMLDMLPLFLFLDEDRVRGVTEDPLIKPRPTFHYRLPDCDIHKPEWGLYLSWNDWIEVERLADDEDRLIDCCSAYDKHLRSPLKRWFGASWQKQLEARWLKSP